MDRLRQRAAEWITNGIFLSAERLGDGYGKRCAAGNRIDLRGWWEAGVVEAPQLPARGLVVGEPVLAAEPARAQSGEMLTAVPLHQAQGTA